jgi:hypothetical protein
MSRATTKPAPQMAYITIGHSDFLLDASKAMKVAELMQHAVDAKWDYYRSEGKDTYIAGDPARVEFRLVRADQVRMPQGDITPVPPARPRLLR